MSVSISTKRIPVVLRNVEFVIRKYPLLNPPISTFPMLKKWEFLTSKHRLLFGIFLIFLIAGKKIKLEGKWRAIMLLKRILKLHKMHLS